MSQDTFEDFVASKPLHETLAVFGFINLVARSQVKVKFIAAQFPHFRKSSD